MLVLVASDHVGMMMTAYGGEDGSDGLAAP